LRRCIVRQQTRAAGCMAAKFTGYNMVWVTRAAIRPAAKCSVARFISFYSLQSGVWSQ